MPSFWAKLVYIFGSVNLSPTEDDGLQQYISPSHNRPISVSADEPVSAVDSSTTISEADPVDALWSGPIFTPPDSSPWSDIECDYSGMRGYKNCSTPGDRGCWLRAPPNTGFPDYTIDTDYENVVPRGKLRKYVLNVTDQVMSPDGMKRTMQVVDGQYPGPWIQACWGDEIEVEVHNSLKENGTTIHWHGVRMLNENHNDGVNAITQCPIAPGSNYTYRFRAMQYGTSWYHSHYSLQYAEGVLGPMTIHGPSTADYDEAKYPLLMTDWAHDTWYSKWSKDVMGFEGNHRSVDNILLNGTGFPYHDHTLEVSDHKNYTLTFEKAKRYLLRLINTSVETAFVFSIDNHKLQVVEADFVPIRPYFTDHVVIGIGQRYHVIVTANPIDGLDKSNKAYWLRTEPAIGCSRDLRNQNGSPKIDWRTGVVRYDDSTDPPAMDMLARGYTNQCRDEPYDKLVPWLPWTIGPPSNLAADAQFELGVSNYKAGPDDPFWPDHIQLQKWNMHTHTMWNKFDDPALRRIWENSSATLGKYDAAVRVVTKPEDKKASPDQWTYILVSGTGVPRDQRKYVPANHPIHLHGHDFAILEQSDKPYRLGGLKLKLDNPPRRDVAFMPSNGYLVLAFKADNPGVWLMHCHIAWHASEGLAMQIIENPNSIQARAVDVKQMEDTCKAWKKWVNGTNHHKFQQDDSGI